MLVNIISGLFILLLIFFLVKCMLIKKKPYYLITASIITIASLMFMPKLADYVVTFLQLFDFVTGNISSSETIEALKESMSSSSQMGKDLILYNCIHYRSFF